MEEQIRQIEENFNKNEIRNFYQGVKKEKRGYQPRVIYCKDKDGNLIGDERARIKRWAEYFEELLNEQDTQQDTNERVNDSDDPEETIEIDEGEIRETLRQMKNNKSPGRNGIKGEMVKYEGEAVAAEIHRLVLECWKEGKMPEQWSEAVFCPIFKKGDITKCENYREIALIDVTYKHMEKRVGEYQAGFRKNRSTVDQIFILKQLEEVHYEQGINLYLLFIAYDTVNRKELLEAMQQLEVPRKLIKLTKMTLQSTRNRVRINGLLSEPFQVRTGLWQGDPISTPCST
ncbi:hypothetical protein Zmor_026733 [Zophobas morio]|uniref:Reverse transcriptase domain-containing protein n=1 Tax=Zophobas morio TaxID=2755281 RepID=A0AA38HV30_9CUCU|nr:hypothetical protein Zmor_026733 [Zophobas morio]